MASCYLQYSLITVTFCTNENETAVVFETADVLWYLGLSISHKKVRLYKCKPLVETFFFTVSQKSEEGSKFGERRDRLGEKRLQLNEKRKNEKRKERDYPTSV